MFGISASQTFGRSASQTLGIHSNFSRRTFAENLEHMELSQEKKEQLLRNVEILQWKTGLLVEACDGWLSAEEGNRNMEKRIRERWRMDSLKGGNDSTTANGSTI
jgi:hypothetical protein